MGGACVHPMVTGPGVAAIAAACADACSARMGRAADADSDKLWRTAPRAWAPPPRIHERVRFCCCCCCCYCGCQ